MIKATLVAFLVLAALGFFAFGVVLADTWDSMMASGVLRTEGSEAVAMSFWMFTLLLTAHLMGHLMTGFWFERKHDLTKYAWQIGLVTGLLWVLPQLGAYFFYNIPSMVPLVQLVYAVIAFPLAGMAFARMYR
ncbi:hypothetical protein HY641_04340 [Candidatus Woesearchaeota archaeon]|nr:hypothetical protein [Candidatus Woesearchaeota archaeon]